MLADIARFRTSKASTTALSSEEKLELMVKLYTETIQLSGGLVPITQPFPITTDCTTVTVTLPEPNCYPSGLYVICLKTR